MKCAIPEENTSYPCIVEMWLELKVKLNNAVSRVLQWSMEVNSAPRECRGVLYHKTIIFRWSYINRNEAGC